MPTRCWELDGTTRFSGRAALYAKGRPSYPAAVIDFIADATGETGAGVADHRPGVGRERVPPLILVLGIAPARPLRPVQNTPCCPEGRTCSSKRALLVLGQVSAEWMAGQ